jgi:threonine/homoserine/homoserine lactone efflux protein
MDFIFLLKGAILGFCIAAPVGPIGILCIRRTVQFGRFSGLFSGLGAAFADTIYGIIAAFGLTFISNFLIDHQFWLQIFGGIFLLYLGAKNFFARQQENTLSVSHKNLWGDFFSTLLLTLTNPMTILSYIAIFASLGMSRTNDSSSSLIALVIGVFLGSILWWLILSEGVTFFRTKLNEGVMVWINRSAGILIALFGIGAIIYALI